MRLSIWWDLEKSDSESVLHDFNDCGKWQPDLHPSVAIGELIVAPLSMCISKRATSWCLCNMYICLCMEEYVYARVSISVYTSGCVCVESVCEVCGSNLQQLVWESGPHEI